MRKATIIVILTTSFLVGLSGALMPGPMLALTISQSARFGFWAGPLIVLGHAILELALVLVLVFGLSCFVGNKLSLSIVGLIGGAVLVYMGVTTMIQGWGSSGLMLSSNSTAPSQVLIFSGIIVSVSNPYWLLWWATIGMTYLLWSLQLGPGGVAAFFTGHISADLIWYSLVAFIVAEGKTIISDAIYRWFLVVCGAAWLASAFTLFLQE